MWMWGYSPHPPGSCKKTLGGCYSRRKILRKSHWPLKPDSGDDKGVEPQPGSAGFGPAAVNRRGAPVTTVAVVERSEATVCSNNASEPRSGATNLHFSHPEASGFSLS